MVGIIGKKVGMTTAYDSTGRSIPCTVLHVGPCVITQIKTAEKDQYEAVQLAYDERKEKNTPKPLQEHFKKANTTPKKQLVEIRDFARDYPTDVSIGDTIQANDLFNEGDKIDVTANSRGFGFQGVVKRHGFGGVGQRTHGQHNRERAPGAIGACATPSRVFKNMKMAGQMGDQRTTIQNLKIIKMVPEENILIVKGAVPGKKNNYLVLKKNL